MDTGDESASLIEQVHTFREDQSPFRIVGQDSKRFLSPANELPILSTERHTGIVMYHPDELVVTVRSGTPLSDLATELASHGQMLAPDPPQFGGHGSVGGAVASGLSGPGRPWFGSLRDSILGVEMINGLGERLNFGGRVMKNVAGYDVSRLMCGASGTLGVILAVSLRLLPRPECSETICKSIPLDDLYRGARERARKPSPVTASMYWQGEHWLRLSGNRNTVTDFVQSTSYDSADGETLWTDIRDHSHPFFSDEGELWRTSLPRGTELHEAPSDTLVEWDGAQVWTRRKPRTVHGDARVRCFSDNREQDVSERSESRYFRQLRDAFDPERLLNPHISI